MAETEPLPKAVLARRLGISISSLYYKPKKPSADWLLKNRIEQVLHEHPSYGHRRLALAMGINKKRIRRVMRLFGIKPYRRRGRKFKKPKDPGVIHPNLIQDMPFPTQTNIIWASDFTYIPFHSRVLYLATIKDVFDRRIVGWSLWPNHSVQLPLTALIDAVEKHGRPQILHSDQGSEYKSRLYASFAQNLGIRLSMSHKGSPWENGFQESFYSSFKVDAADFNRFRTVGELIADIYFQIHYYNHERIHTKLKVPPATFAERR
ncbi:MAG TPA: IS3 family transposase [Patescibacteria group bacterium]|nr:IS3 family transposase [Patescibacteria group bacterium]